MSPEGSSAIPGGIQDPNLGLPLKAGTRMRLIKRIIVKVCGPFLIEQIAFNNSVVAQMQRTTEQVSQRLDEIDRLIGAFAERLAPISGDLAQHVEVLTRQDIALERHEAIVRRLDIAFDETKELFELLQDKMDLAVLQMIARYQEGIGLLRIELEELGQELTGVSVRPE